MKNRILFAIFSLFALLILSLPFAQAGQITLEIATTTGISDSLITADFRITNKGIDPAHEVSVQGRFLDQRNNAFIADRIAPGTSAESRLDFKRAEGVDGSFPLYVSVTYQHPDNIGVSSVSLARVNSGNAIQNILAAKAVLEDEEGRGHITVYLETSNPDLKHVTVTGHGPGDLYIEPPFREIDLQDGKGTATFAVSNISGNVGSTYGVFFAAEYEHNSRHDFAAAEIAIPVEVARPADSVAAEALRTRLYGLVLAAAALFIIIIIISTRARHTILKIEKVPHLLDIFVLIAVEVFIFSKFDLVSLLTATTTTGGDTASHYYTLEYLRHTLLPAGKISGWTMGNYAGFPILQFYFPLPFLLMSFLDLFMPLQVAFKLVTLAGTALLPIGAYIMLRFIRCPFPGPGIGAALMLPFIFNPANSMWGGNILSTLAGEFSYSLSMALSLILIGSLYRGALEDKGVVRNAVLVFLVGFSHGYTLLFVEAMSLFLLVTPYGFTRRFFYLFRVYALGFCMLAFWLVPLLVFTRYTTSYHLVWTIGSIKEIVPEILLPVVILGVGGSVILLAAGLLRFRTDGREILKPLAFLWFGLAAAVVFFVVAPRIGVVDIRYVPYGQLMTCLMAALFLGWAARYLLNRWGLSYLFLIVATVVVMSWTGGRLGPVPGWSKWNYEGFEAKKSWPLFEQINKTLAGNFNDPRVVYEHSQDHNIFGSSRAFESLPLFAGRATLEGLYMQASITAPFVFYIQSMISHQSSQPFPQYSYTSMDLARARDYLKLFNVRELLMKSSAAKQAINHTAGYSRLKTMGKYEIWQLTENRDRYVEVLDFEPVAYIGSEPWKQVAHQWFSRDDLPDIHLVFPEKPVENPANREWLSVDSPDVLPRKEVDNQGCNLKESIRDNEILLETSCPGKPHLVKVSYHPNWQVDGAERIYLVSPSFMLIYPQKEQVHLFYGPGPWDRLGQLLTFACLVILLLQVPLSAGKGRTGWDLLKNRFWRPDFFHFRLAFDPSSSVRRLILLAVLMGGGTFVAAVAYQAYVHEPYRAYNRAIRSKDDGQYEEARAGFRSFMQTYPMANLARESSYYLAITYYLENRDNEALRGFEEYLLHYPQGSRAAEVHYHIGLVLLRSGRQKEGVGRMVQLIAKFPGTEWAGYAGTRLQEHGFAPDGAQIDTREN